MSELEALALVKALLWQVGFLAVVAYVFGFFMGWISEVRKQAFSRVWAFRELRQLREARRRLRARQT